MRIYSIIFFLFSSFAFAQVGGEEVYLFLNQPTSARQTAMGGAVLTLTDDVNQPLWNPASINNDLDGKLSLNYLNYLTDINYFSGTYAYMVDRRIGTFHGGLTYLNYGSFIGADENGVETGTFKAYDMSLSLGYARQLPYMPIYVGANVKVISSVIEQYHSMGAAVDIGLLYYDERKPYRFGLVVRNFGMQITQYTDLQERLPLQVILSGSFKPEYVPVKLYGSLTNLQKWQIAYANPSDATTDFENNTIINKPDFFDNTLRHIVIGAELFPDKPLNIRAGINFQRAQEVGLNFTRTFAGLSAGFGLKFENFHLNYAFSKFHPATDAHTFSLEINL